MRQYLFISILFLPFLLGIASIDVRIILDIINAKNPSIINTTYLRWVSNPGMPRRNWTRWRHDACAPGMSIFGVFCESTNTWTLWLFQGFGLFSVLYSFIYKHYFSSPHLEACASFKTDIVCLFHWIRYCPVLRRSQVYFWGYVTYWTFLNHSLNEILCVRLSLQLKIRYKKWKVRLGFRFLVDSLCMLYGNLLGSLGPLFAC